MIKKENFKNPPSLYRSAPFWSLNDKLEPGELKRQIREFHSKGLGGAFLHPRGGMSTEYLSDEFFKALRNCMDEFKTLGMLGWLYDEDRFPSGVAGGKVLKINPDFSQKSIVLRIVDGEKVRISENTLALFLLKEDTYERILPDQLPSTGRVLLVSVEQASRNPRFDNESMVDILNKEAIDCFIELTHERYYREFGDCFGKTIPAIFTDEPHFKPTAKNALPWSYSVPEKFITKNQYDIINRLPELFLNIGNYQKVRFDYWDTICSLSVESYSKNIYNWCEEKSIAYTGHFWEHVFPSPAHNGSVMPHYEYMQYPGIDMLFVSDPNEVNMYGNDLIVKEVSSVANQLGKERVLTETHGASGWGLDFAYQKRATDWQLTLGINLFCQHLSLYSMVGYRKRDFPLSFLDHQPWWKDYKLLGDYMGRLSYAMAQGKYKADVLVLHPSSSTWTAYAPYENNTELMDIERSIKNLVKNLNQLRIMFDLGDDTIMTKHANVQNGLLTIGQMNYSVIILPQMDLLRGRVFELLKEFLSQGGVIITTGKTPTLLDGVPSPEVVDFFNDKNIIKTLNEKAQLSDILLTMPVELVPLYELENKDLSDVYAHVRCQGDKKVIFLCNLNMDEKLSLRLFIDKPCYVEQFDGETGEILTCDIGTDSEGRFYISFTLDALNSVLFMLNESQPVEPKKENCYTDTGKLIRLADWVVETKDKNAINLQFCRASLKNEPYSQIDDVLAIDDTLKKRMGVEIGNINMRQPWMYSEEEKSIISSVKAEYPFIIDEIPSGTLLAAIELDKIFSVYINDQKIMPTDGFYKDRTFILYDIKPYVKKGVNIIRLESTKYSVLVNLESVYIVGDFKLINSSDGFSITRPTYLSTGNLVEQGYQYYSGIVSYSTEININSDFREATFSFDRFYGVSATVIVNRRPVRTLGWKPYSANITNYLVKGTNEITIEIANSLQNLLGPFGIDSNLSKVTPGSFYAKEHVKFTPVGFDGKAQIILK